MRFSGKTLFYLPLLAVIGCLIYSNSFQNSFHLDDHKVIVANEAIRDLRDVGGAVALFDAFNTRFLTGLSLAANYALGKLDVRGYHAFNLTVHILNSSLVFALVLLTLRTPWMAFCAALLFLTHPIQTQAVNYIWQRAALLAAFFHLAALVLYIQARVRGSKIHYGLSFLAAFLGMFTKETMIVCPVTILLYEFFFFDATEGDGKRMLRLLPYLALCAVIPILLTRADHLTLKTMRLQEMGDITRFVSEGSMSRKTYMLTQLPVLVTYLRLLVFPAGLNLDHDFPLHRSFAEPAVWLSAIFLIVLLGAGVLLFKKKDRLLAFAIFWFFLVLSLESLVPQNDVLFEHRLYLGTAPFAVFISAVLFRFLGKRAFAVVLLIAAVFSFFTYQRNFVWKNELSLWGDVLLKSPHKARPYNNRGFGFMESGRLEEAMADFKKAVILNPNYAEVHANLGIVEDRRDRLPEAIVHYSKAIRLDPSYAKALNNRGVDYQIQKEYDKAIADLTEAVRIKPNYSQAYNNRGNCFQLMGRTEEAIEDYGRAIEADATNAEAYFNRGVAYLGRREKGKALADFDGALQLKPGFQPALKAKEGVR